MGGTFFIGGGGGRARLPWPPVESPLDEGRGPMNNRLVFLMAIVIRI